MTTRHVPPWPLPAAPDGLSVWPASATRLPGGGLAVAGVALAEIADRFGTPAAVLDEARCAHAAAATAGPCPTPTSSARRRRSSAAPWCAGWTRKPWASTSARPASRHHPGRPAP